MNEEYDDDNDDDDDDDHDDDDDDNATWHEVHFMMLQFCHVPRASKTGPANMDDLVSPIDS